MAINREITERLRALLKEHPKGLSITDIVKTIPINRNTASRYLDTLLVSGQVEMRHFGMAKIYSLSERLPVSSVLAISSEYVLQLDQGLRIIFVNAPFLDLLEIPERDLAGRKIEFTRIPALFDEEFSRLQSWISDGHSGIERKGEITLPAKGRIFSCRVSPAVFAEGQKGVSVLLEDITARKRDEQRLRESEGRFRSIVEASTDGIFVCDEQGCIIEWNDALYRITGISREEAIGRPLLDLIIRSTVPEDRNGAYIDSIRSELKNAFRKRKSRYILKPFEVAMIRPDGERRIIRQTLFPIETERGVRIGSVVHDITERMTMMEDLKESEARLKSIVRAAPVGIGLVVNRVIREVNNRLCTLTGYAAGELIGQSARMLYPSSEEFELVGFEKYRQIARDGTGSVETRWRKKDGEIIDILLSSTPLDPDDHSAGVIFTALDVTDHMRAETALRESEERYRNLVEISPDVVLLHQEGKIIYGNPAAVKLLGCSHPGELIGKPILDFIDPASRDIVNMNIRKDLDGVESPHTELTMLRLDGTRVAVEGRGVRTFIKGKPAVMVTIRDVTQRNQAEQAIRSSEVRYRQLLERSFNAVIVHKEGKILLANESACAIAGVQSPDELIGKPIDMFIHPDFHQVIRERIAKMLATPGTAMPLMRQTFLRINGEPVEVEVMATSYSDNGTPAFQVIFREIPRPCP
jgi:PAS domain S-box-containing protein